MKRILVVMLIMVLILSSMTQAFAARKIKPDPDPDPVSDVIELNQYEHVSFTLKVNDRTEGVETWTIESTNNNTISLLGEPISYGRYFEQSFEFTGDNLGADTVTLTYPGKKTVTFTKEFMVNGETNNTAPVFSQSEYSITTVEDVAVTAMTSVSDTIGDTHSYSIVGNSAEGTVVNNHDGTFTYTPNLNYNGLDSFSVQVTDQGGLFDTATINITVDAINDDPVIIGHYNVSTPLDTPVEIIINAEDVDNNNLIYSFSNVSNGTVSNVDNIYTYTPASTGDHTFDVIVSDGVLGSTDAVEKVYVSVANVNSSPVITLITSPSTDEDPSAAVSIATVADDGIILSVSSTSSNGTVSLEDNSIKYMPNINYFGNDTFTIRVEDEFGAFDEATINVTVYPVNDAPNVEIIGNIEVTEGVTTTFTVGAMDVDNDTLAYSVEGAIFGEVSIDQSGNVDYTANSGTMDSFTISVSDGTVDVLQTVNVTIIPVATSFSYVSLGDSIAAGVYYEGSIFNPLRDANSYVEQLDAYLSLNKENYTGKDFSISGLETWQVLAQLDNPTIASFVTNADLITLSVGANDIMQAAMQTNGDYDFYNINWQGDYIYVEGADDGDYVYLSANAGRTAFTNDWQKLIYKINELNPDVELIVLNLYNPYKKENEPIDSTIYSKVNDYFYNTAIPGLNDIIDNTMIMYDTNDGMLTDITLDYQVVDLYNEFETNDVNKTKYTNFYDYYIIRYVNDPHLNQDGHNKLYQMVLDTFLN